MDQSPAVTIGICAHNEEGTIGTLIEEVMAETIPLEEVIVVVAGEDATADIVAEKEESYPAVQLVEEKERRGQVYAQNEILSRASGEALLLLDGDGTIRPGSLEALYDRFDGTNVVSGREIPVTGDSFIGHMLDVYGEVHHRLCLTHPRFTTQMGIMPAGLVERFPDIVLDDAFIEHRAEEEGLEMVYEPGAVKYHHVPHRALFLFHQQKRNWAGRFQADARAYRHAKARWNIAATSFRHLLETGPRHLPAMASWALLEVAAYAAGRIHQLMGTPPVKWWRPS